jgi:uncharacterized protein YndB with AHSA1/START domain
MKRSAVHDNFSYERHYDVTPARVFKAFADPQAKAQWFNGPEGSKQEDMAYDFRVGGQEKATTIVDEGRYGFLATYADIVPAERIVYTYEMAANGQRTSISLVTIELRPGSAGGTDLVLTEQGVYLDGMDDPAARREGTTILLANLEASLADR